MRTSVPSHRAALARRARASPDNPGGVVCDTNRSPPGARIASEPRPTGTLPDLQPIDSDVPYTTDTPPRLILASTSHYRRELLQRLRLPFSVEPPGVDETPRAAEAPCALARRLALEKAHAVAQRHPDAVVIGSDQVADLDGQAIGKPGDHTRAREQLRRMSGRLVVFQTALAVVRVDAGFEAVEVAEVRVHFRALDDARIEHYLRTERPYDCAGSARSEALGIALLESIESDDPTALVGLPLIRTCTLLAAAGLDPLIPSASAGRTG
jgi:septum formation protein